MARSRPNPANIKSASPIKGKRSKRAERDPKTPWFGVNWRSTEARKWYILIGLSIVISVLLFPNVLVRTRSYGLGDVADGDIKASRNFLVENGELTEQNRQEALKKVLSVYDFDPSGSNIVVRIRDAFKACREYVGQSLTATHSPRDPAPEEEKVEQGAIPPDSSFEDAFFELLNIAPNGSLFRRFSQRGFSPDLENTTVRLLTHVLKNGVVSDKAMLLNESARGITLRDIYSLKERKITELSRFLGVEEAREFTLAQGKIMGPSEAAPAVAALSAELAAALVKPNVTFNRRETELRKEEARNSVKPFYFKVKRGEMLVREGERISAEHVLKLREHDKLFRKREMLSRVPAMTILVGFLISSLYVVGLMTRRSPGGEVRDMLFNAVTLMAVFLVVMASDFVAEETARGFNSLSPRALLFAMPVAAGAMLVGVFQGFGVAVTVSLILSVLAALVIGNGSDFFVYFFISSLVAAHGVRSCRERGILIRTGLKVGLVNSVLAASITALHGSIYTVEALIALASAFIGGILVGVITTGILPLAEMSFGFTTDIKLLELANLDKPLLRELMVRCPGTHHHSVIVSSMVEASAAAIQANPLLAKVAAYYHDIGKMKKPLYFIENQRDRENKHEKLAPSMSSLILISHVKDGVELARENKLGREIIDIIQQHHGTSLISYFFEKARDQWEKSAGKTPQAKEEAFRYPGPKPQTKEAGLVMLADVAEAASRSMVDPTAARIQGMVQRIINRVFSDGQLDECELTLKDLHEIAKSFNKTLSGIFHHRVEYPGSAVVGSAGRKTENGYTDMLPTGDPRGQKQDNRGESGESLRRLGLS